MKNRAYFGTMSRVFSLMVFLLAACSTTPDVKYYTLNPLSDMQPDIPQGVSGDTLVIGVGPVEFPRFLDRPQIVTRRSQNRVEVSEFHRWAGSFSENFTGVGQKYFHASTCGLGGRISLGRPVFSDLSYSADCGAV